MDGARARQAFVSLTREFAGLYGCDIAAVACDLHPDYFTTRWARGLGLRVLAVQHRHAHAVACMVEHDLLEREVLALTWDGTGYGADATVWGGEVLRVTVDGYERVASLRPFPLPGNEAAIRQPNRVALGVLAATLGPQNLLSDGALLHGLDFRPNTARTLLHMTDRGVNTPWTSSVGRLFDAVPALLLQAKEVSYEGEAAAWLEAVVNPRVTEAYPIPFGPAPVDGPQAGEPRLLSGDWRPLFRALLEDIRLDVPVGISAARFHNALVEWAARVAAHQPCAEVVLGGGCFQSGWLTERTKAALQSLGRRVYCPGHVPPGDGGIAAGQLAVALAALSPSGKGNRMCLGIRGQVVTRHETADELPFALVQFAGLRPRVCVACVPEVEPGDYVLVHAGIAISRIDAAEAERVLAHLRAMGELDDAEALSD
jgi:hydrogenase maturation protein HypF